MKVKGFVAKWEGKSVEDCGSYVGEEWKTMFRDLRSVVRDICKSIEANLVTFRSGHYDCSGFVERNGKYVYVSMGQDALRGRVVLTKPAWAGPILVRTAASDKDYHGGHNNFVTLDELAGRMDTLLHGRP